jgi:retron-type reverse transcriptase
MQAGVPQGSILSPTLYNLYINDTANSRVNLAPFADDTCLYVTERKEGLRSQKTPTRPELSGGLVWALER